MTTRPQTDPHRSLFDTDQADDLFALEVFLCLLFLPFLEGAGIKEIDRVVLVAFGQMNLVAAKSYTSQLDEFNKVEHQRRYPPR